jgi:malonyl CoA-acyl carrier protein transacylase
MTVAYVFPGQGSHRVGMGGDLFDRYPHLVRQADALLGYRVADLCRDGPAQRLADTRYTQPAVYVVAALAYVDHVRRGGAVPDLLGGHSLGEYVALFAAGAVDFLTGLEVVAERARLMADAGPGGMTAVLGLGPDQTQAVLDRCGRPVDVANLNSPEQTVIAGPLDDLAAVEPALAETATAVVRLDVSGAFHSRHMAGAAAELATVLDRYRFGRLKIPVVSTVTAAPYPDDPDDPDDGVADLLCRQLTAPVRWTETVRRLLAQPAPEIRELGPGTVLTGLVRAIERVELSGARNPG